MTKEHRFILKVALFLALFVIGFIFHDAILGVAK